MGNLATEYRKARALLRLGSYEAWLVECIVNLLIRHDDRVAAEKRLIVESPEERAFRELAKWAADNLKRKQRRMVELLIANNGRLPMADLNLACEWHGDEFGRCRQHVNKRLRKAGWLVERHDNEARLRQAKGRQK